MSKGLLLAILMILLLGCQPKQEEKVTAYTTNAISIVYDDSVPQDIYSNEPFTVIVHVYNVGNSTLSARNLKLIPLGMDFGGEFELKGNREKIIAQDVIPSEQPITFTWANIVPKVEPTSPKKVVFDLKAVYLYTGEHHIHICVPKEDLSGRCKVPSEARIYNSKNILSVENAQQDVVHDAKGEKYFTFVFYIRKRDNVETYPYSDITTYFANQNIKALKEGFLLQILPFWKNSEVKCQVIGRKTQEVSFGSFIKVETVDGTAKVVCKFKLSSQEEFEKDVPIFTKYVVVQRAPFTFTLHPRKEI